MARRRRRENSAGALAFVWIVIPLVFFGLGYLFWNVWDGNTKVSTEANMKFIIDHCNGAGKLIDFQREICVESVDDIKLFVEKNNVKIEYGKIVLEWPLEEFVSPELTGQLERIGITRYKDAETGRLLVFYHDEEVERWVH